MMASIQTFSIDDYNEVLALWQATPGVGLSDADSRAGVAAYLARNQGLSFVARVEGRLVGAVLCGTDGRRGYLHHLAVHPDFRRQGIGQALAERCLAELKAQGINKCHLFVFAGNADGRAFWERTGWKQRTDLEIMSKGI